MSEIFDETLYGSEISPNKKKNMEYLLKKYSISKEEFCYIGDTVQDIKDCQEAGVICFSAAWQESSNAAIWKKKILIMCFIVQMIYMNILTVNDNGIINLNGLGAVSSLLLILNMKKARISPSQKKAPASLTDTHVN